MRVIGTAGHVDHGKSTLIAALTGIHPDRLKEEREREMTIDLGFGWLTLPDGQEIGIVDVPGHRDFIENMLAGVGGIDAALLVIAADEGVMPQTREHLAILDLLNIQHGLVALTKLDMVTDADWLALVEEDIRRALSGTSLQDAPIVRVSARSGLGLDSLRQTLSEILQKTSPRPNLMRPRLPIDRVFTRPGFGTVVTGTLSDGQFSLGDEVEILPSAKRARIRGLQTHKQKQERAVPGSRTAINLAGVALDEIQRGEVVAAPGAYRATRRMDIRFRLLKDVSAALKHAVEVKVFAGTAESLAVLRLLDTDLLAPGGESWAQLELRQPLVVARGDRIILRRPSPSETLGGGLVVDAAPGRRHRRFDEATLAALETLQQGDPAEVLILAALALGAASARETVASARLEGGAAAQALQAALASGRLIALEAGEISPSSDILLMAAPRWEELRAAALSALQAFHQNFPLRRGMPREELKSRLKISPRLMTALVKRLELREGGAWLALPGHEIRFSPPQQARAEALLKKFAASPFAPPSVKECQAEAGEDLYAALVELGQLLPVSAEVVFRRADYEIMLARLREFLQANGQITAAEARDLFSTSRKYSLAFLEYLDSIGVTIRSADFRRLKQRGDLP
ncbi:MAG: selenocysteine-specific translation elongation factor [Anaerolineales bacterium]